MNQTTLINGKRQTQIDVSERSNQFGDGLFETCLIKNKQILFWDLHFNRLLKGLKKLQINNICEKELLEDISKIKTDNCVIKIIISRGQSLRGYGFDANIKPTRMLVCAKIPIFKDEYQLNICKSGYASNKNLAGIKHNNRLEQILAKMSVNLDDGIMLDENNTVISTTSANIFMVKDGIITTPDLSHCGINGTRRECLIKKYPILINKITLDELKNADEVFLTNSIMGIKKVVQIDDIFFSTHKITNEINF